MSKHAYRHDYVVGLSIQEMVEASSSIQFSVIYVLIRGGRAKRKEGCWKGKRGRKEQERGLIYCLFERRGKKGKWKKLDLFFVISRTCRVKQAFSKLPSISCLFHPLLDRNKSRKKSSEFLPSPYLFIFHPSNQGNDCFLSPFPLIWLSSPSRHTFRKT